MRVMRYLQVLWLDRLAVVGDRSPLSRADQIPNRLVESPVELRGDIALLGSGLGTGLGDDQVGGA